MEKVSFLMSLILVVSSGGQDGPNSCDSKDSGCFGEPASWKIYRRNIAKAVESYVDCPSTNCSCYQHVVNDDLKPWKDSGITKEMISAALPYGVHYRIVNHRLFRQPDCMFLFRCKGVEHFILSVIEELDDTEFLLNTRDWPQIHRLGPRIPVLSFSKTSEYMDIMYPAWSFWEGGPAISLYPTGIGRWDLLRESLKRKGQEYYWSRKLSKGFFRGSRTSAERDPLVLLSREDPELVDAQYTKNQAWKSDADTLGAPPASEVSFEDHCRYKFLFNFRGVAASFRLKHLFLCKSLVFHVGDEWREFFYAALLPWVHYIPVSPDLSDVRDLLSFAKSNEAEVKWIAKRGYDFIWNHLKMEDVQCYWRSLLNDYRQLLRFKVNLGVTDDLIEIL